MAELRNDLRRWRRLVTHCAKAREISEMKKIEEEYYVLQGRITRNSRSLAEQTLAKDGRRGTLLEIDRLVRPWMTAEVVHDAPKPVVADLMAEGQRLEDQLAGKQRRHVSRVQKYLALALLAGLGGLLTVFAGSWLADSGWMWLDAVTYSIAERIRGFGFVEQFGIAVVCSWLFGTWLLSSMYKS